MSMALRTLPLGRRLASTCSTAGLEPSDIAVRMLGISLLPARFAYDPHSFSLTH
jgi:hypothetical protein